MSSWSRRSPSKTGPLKATLPVSSLTRQYVSSEAGNESPCHQPYYYRTRCSPPSATRSPGAYKGEEEGRRGRRRGRGEERGGCGGGGGTGQLIRRTASLDTIYLTGQWPRESLYLSSLLVDRATQTDDWLSDPRKALRHQDSANEDKLEKLIRHRMQRSTKEGSSSRERTAAFSLLGGGGSGGGGSGSSNPPSCVTSGDQQKQRLRSSVEGLNQEIERLVLSYTPLSSSTSLSQPDDRKRSVEEGHRAPVAELIRETRSVNTQTPAYSPPLSSGPPSRNSPYGGPSSNPSDSRGSSELPEMGVGGEDSSPETEGRGLGTSPRINRFLAREPPDGCERVCSRFTEERRPMVDISEVEFPPLKPSVNFQLKPSLGSAFQPLRSTQ